MSSRSLPPSDRRPFYEADTGFTDYHFDSCLSPPSSGMGVSAYDASGQHDSTTGSKPMTATGMLTSIGSSPASMSQDGAVSAGIPSRHCGKLDTFGMPATGGYYAAFLSSGFASGSGTASLGLYVYCKCSGPANSGPAIAPYSSDGGWLGADAIGN